LLAARQYQSIKDSVGLGYTYNNIGEVYKKLNDYDKALEYLFKSKALKKYDTASQALTLYNIAEVYLLQNKIKEAEEYLDESLTIALYEENERVIAFNFWGIGTIDRKAKNYDKALNSYHKAETIWKKIGEIRSLVKTYQEIAEIYREQRQYAQAEEYLTKAMQLASNIKVPDLQINNYLRLSSLDSVRGNYKRALYYFMRHTALKDSVYNILKAEQIARLQTIYETEARDQENKQLRAEKALNDSKLGLQRTIIFVITAGLILAGILAWFLFRQRRKITFQKEAIEIQARALIQLNKDLKELNRNLEARIDHRTQQLIVQNQKITEYTFINAHKLRAPVASILGLINLIDQVSPEEREAIIIHLKTCGEQLDSIIHEVSRNLEASIVSENR
jgi:tetratricopeptide (TPR) repeat protein